MFRLIAIAFTLTVALGATTQARAGALSLYGRLPTIETVALSPKGDRLAIVRTDGEKRILLVIDTSTLKTVGGLNTGDHKIRSLRWMDSDNLLITESQTFSKSEAWMTVLFTVSQNRQQQLLANNDDDILHGRSEAFNVILNDPVMRIVNGRQVLFVEGVSIQEDAVRTMFREDLNPMRARPLRQGTRDTTGFLLGSNGEVAVETGENHVTRNRYVWVRDGGALKPADLPDGVTEGPFVYGLSPGGDSAIMGYQKGVEQFYAELDLESRQWRPLTWSGDFDAPIFDPLSDKLMGLETLKGDETTVRFLDPTIQGLWASAAKSLSGQKLTFLGVSDDHKRLLVEGESPQSGPAFYLIDLVVGKIQVIGDAYEGMKPSDISPVRPVAYKAADGTEITGYLTVPAGAGPSPKGLPLIVLPHGGPESRDVPGFDWWAQALASRGYAVLQPNFRGSSGFGRAFTEKGFGEFGLKMQTDLSDGVRYLAGEGVIDPKRVCIVGGSYGGYAALAGATLDKGVYRCAASVAGISDLRRMLMLDLTQSTTDRSFRYWKKFMGVETMRDPKVANISPITHVSEITIPVLLIHGKDDTVVEYDQSRLMADAMKKAGKPVEFVTLDGEDHWLSRSATRLKMLESVVAFVEKNNPPK